MLSLSLLAASQVGAATAANGFFRKLGVLLGTALVGADHRPLSHLLAARLLGPGIGIDPDSATPERLSQLPPDLCDPLAGLYGDALTRILPAGASGAGGPGRALPDQARSAGNSPGRRVQLGLVGRTEGSKRKTSEWKDGRHRHSALLGGDPGLQRGRLPPDDGARAAGQDFPGVVEVIVVDNGSTDGTANRARRLGVRVVEERTPGVCAARQRDTLRPQRNRGVHRCRHRAPQDWLTRLDARLTADPTIVAVAGPRRYADPPWWAAVVPPLCFAALAALHDRLSHVGYITATNVTGVDG